MALKSTIDLTCNDYISVFEFDIFTRLFQVVNKHTHTHSAPLLIIGSSVNEERNRQRNGLIEIETDGG